MEVLSFLIAITLLILAITGLSRLGRLETRLDDLGVLTRDLSETLRDLRFRPVETDARQKSAPEILESIPVVEKTEASATPEPDAAPGYRGAAPPPLPARNPVPHPLVTPRPAPVVAVKSEPGRFESTVREILGRIWNWIVVGEEHRPKGVTMEFAVATTWLIRVGVLILVIGIGFFLKYSITKGYIGPTARVLLTTLAGAGLVAGGLKLFSGRYRVLGQGLAGAGFATLYFSFFTAHQPGYELYGPIAAFALMILVTATAGLVAVRFNSLLVAVLGLLGGYGTPLMIRTGNDSVVMLFSYVLLLGLGMFFIAARKEWRLLHYLSFLATCLLVILALDRCFSPARFGEFMPFLLAFFALFSSATFVYQLIHRKTSTVLELLFLFLNAAAFTGFAIGCITEI